MYLLVRGHERFWPSQEPFAGFIDGFAGGSSSSPRPDLARTRRSLASGLLLCSGHIARRAENRYTGRGCQRFSPWPLGLERSTAAGHRLAGPEPTVNNRGASRFAIEACARSFYVCPSSASVL